jgi:hypothetical protein
MITILGTILSSLLSGGATGLLGVFIQRFFDIKNKREDLEVLKLQHANTVALEEIRLRHTAMEVEGKVREVQAEADGVEAKAHEERLGIEAQVDAEIRAAAMEADKASYFGLSRSGSGLFGSFVDGLVSLLFGIVDFVRGMTRPVLTAALVVMTYQLYTLLGKLGMGLLDASTIMQLWLQIVGAIIYLTTVAVIFWFGNRPPSKEK